MMFQLFIFQRFADTTSLKVTFSACIVFTGLCSSFKSSDNDSFPNTRFENALSGEQMRLRIYTYKCRDYGLGGVAMVAHRGPLLVSGADSAYAVSSNGEEGIEDYFLNDEKPGNEKFFGITEKMPLIDVDFRRY
jgi:hypothetical protein